MLKERARLIEQVLFLVDLLFTAAAFEVTRLLLSAGFGLHFQEFLLPLRILVVLIWAGLLKYFRVYGFSRPTTFVQEVLALTKVVLVGGVVLGFSFFFLKHETATRFFLVCFMAVDLVLLCIIRAFMRVTNRFLLKKGCNARYMILVGDDERALEFARMVDHAPWWGTKFLGFVTTGAERPAENIGKEYPILGHIGELPRIVTERVVDEVVFLVPRRKLHEMEDVLLFLEELGISTRLALNFFPNVETRASISNIGDVPMVEFSTTPAYGFTLFVKEILDHCISFIVMVFLSPMVLFIALAVKITSPGPVLMKQVRCGLHGRKFRMYTFRTFRIDNNHNTSGKRFHPFEGLGPQVTPLGRWLIKRGWDKLPQFYNVLKGDMSLVGPQPPLPREVDRYERWQRRQLSMKPGITCLWRVNGKHKLDFIQRIKMDLEYIDNWRLKLDFKILLKTIPVLLSEQQS